MMKDIRYPWGKPMFWGKEEAYVRQALSSSWISGGPYVDTFETGFSRLLNVSQVVTTSNGTTALQVALLGLGIKPNDEVIVPGFMFAAAANMVIAVGAIPVFVDVKPGTWCIDPLLVQGALSKKTKAVIAVHTYGGVCDMHALNAICRRHKLLLIEDAAEALFSNYDGMPAGTLSMAGTFSFHATKTMAMGEGGCVVTANQKLAEKMRTIRNHGMTRRRHYWHAELGHNFRLPNLQAAIGCAQLEKTPQIISRKKDIYESYRKRLKSLDGMELQNLEQGVDPTMWVCGVVIQGREARRDRVMQQMLNQGIETRPGFGDFSQMPVYKPFRPKKLPVSSQLCRRVMTLPSYLSLKDSDIEEICAQFRQALSLFKV